MTLPDGRRVIADRYRLMAPVGRGGAGIVWRARDDLLDRDVAVKEIAGLVALDADELADTYAGALREARAAARITHSGVAAVYDVVTQGGCPYIIMELIWGRSLSGLIEDNGPLALADVAEIGRQVLAALMAGHAAGVLHRDLKPGNVLITSGGRAVLTDFGIASLTGDLSMTRTGVVVGTPGYLAPERIRGDPATPAADLWSLGATLYAAACGRGPFDGYDGAIPTMYKIATEEPRELTAGGPLREIVGALLSRDPRLRPSATDTAQALDAAVEILAGSVPALADPGEPAAERAGDRRALRTVTSGLLTGHPATDAGIAVRPRRRGHHAGVLLIGLAGVAAAGVIVVAVILGHPAHRTGSAALVLAPAVATQFRVAAAADAGGSTELFARATDGTLMDDTLTGGVWSGWIVLPGGKVYSGVPAVTSGAAGQLVVLARTDDGKLAELWQATPGSRSWGGPVTLGAQLISSDPSVIAGPDGHLEAFARLSDGSLGYVTQTSTAGGGTWSGLTSLGGTLASPPVAAMHPGGQQYVFALASGGALVYYSYQDGAWAGPRVLPGGHSFTGVPAVGTNLDGRLEVFARTSAGTIEHVWQQPGAAGRWGGPLVLISNAVSNPAVFSANGGRLEVFAAAASGQIIHTWQLHPVAGTGWNRPVSLGGSAAGAPEVIRPAGRSELFVRSRGGMIAFDHLYMPIGTWSGWSGLGGSF
ncbi:MAG TPA: protein kinase [Streptosporangiaceae bacterium]|nr:protein kinase [Streptosporangiaceae bacterium]